ncbi:MAG: beta-ketoacyl-[acyl-carrier-protein] synthase family protein [Saprospiraceae bacterium]|jgi:3-oxoacyl-[acyl-carrier-protein] synthase-1|nr:beta-ketoacyl-[acyl-carrier-protein] synthase family protein [Saprospiraceae bacterium]MBX7179068.1 beta-ketoacyl-[acyl-carrier-protein] synthase family protein [Saprospiraceae bacterium]MCB0590139.1 beta-ketoacyl-[acyl-carrier-protein] synthase family protein [Saprospiraceae bacterium]MCO5284070.1 beta-ketoacyl-[acyl-carrier-protein] synthase family protein [Saprospiraceae bacterium]MCO6470815.1 beta-ketoacyl-[acyl-carrier-protein] synthase family protein [Saprospiraceae bacterium]
MNRVVITGMGIYSCIGLNKDEVLESLRQGRSGITYDAERKDFGYRSALVGLVPRPDLKGHLDRRARIMLPEEGEFAYIATKEAFTQAGITPEILKDKECGIIFGNDSTVKAVYDSIELVKQKKDTTLLGSGAIFQSMNSTVNMNLSTIFALKGVNFTLSAACASGSHSIGIGYLLIKQGLQKMVLCGGAQEVNIYAFASFDGLGTFSIRESEPEKASRPFDRDRDGLVPAGGAAALVLESLESALARGANIIAEVIGYGFSSNGEHISGSSKEGQVRSLRMALEQAGLKPKDIDYVNAHATSTPAGDTQEAQAIAEVFGDKEVPVSSTKSMTGHECWMAGASEAIYSTLMLNNNFIAPNINFEHPDEHSAKLDIVTKATEKELNIVLSNSFGFGGTNSTLILKKFIE